MAPSDTRNDRKQQIFISYARADEPIARGIKNSLQIAGINVWADEIKIGDSISSQIEKGIQESDLFLVLLSQHSVKSEWVVREVRAALSRESSTGSVKIIPVLIEDCEIPPFLAMRNYLDLRKDPLSETPLLFQLLQQIEVVPEIDFYRLEALSFERLVADLLKKLGFSIEHKLISSDSGFDFVASFVSNDPFGVKQSESWLVDVKFYQNERVSLQAIRKMVGYMVTVSRRHKGLIVTNGHLTSVAEKYHQDIVEKSGQELRIINGTELRALLINHPDIIKRYFDKGAAE